MCRKSFLDNKEYCISLNNISKYNFPWENLNSKTILVVGAAGLLGSYICDVFMAIQKKYSITFKVYALGRNVIKLRERFDCYKDNENFMILSQDITNPFSTELESIDADYIFHFASNTHPVDYATKPIDTIMTNILGTNLLLNYAVRHKTEKFLYASSVEIYGENRGDIERFNENYCGFIDCNTLRAGYPEGKRAGEALCQAYISQYDVNIIIPRLCRCYGETMLMSDTKALSQFIKKALNNENIVLKSPGEQLYSYLHISDAVSAILFCFFYGVKGEAYNIADEKSDIKLKDLAGLISEIANTKVVFELPDVTEQSGYSKATKALLDSTKIKRLGWHSEYNIKEGLKHTIEILGDIYNV